MNNKLQCQNCGRAEYGEDLYNYDGELLCRYCIVARVCESLIPCEYVGTCNDRTFPNKTEQITQLKQQLAEKQKTIDEINKEFVQAIHDWKTLCAEKDKEIERLKNLFELNNEVVINQGKEIFDLRVQVLQQKQNQTQLAIQELEKVKDWLNEPFDEDGCFKNGGDLIGFVDQQIKKLKGEKDVED